MSRIFYRKSTSIAFVAAMLILVLLVCMLLVTLMQMSSLKQRAEKLNEMIAAARQDEQKLQELIDYLKTDDYVREWAENHNRINSDDITWLNDHIPKN